MNKLIRFLAVGLGTGLIPKSPGTAGSAAALVIAYFYSFNFWQLIILCIMGVFICAYGEKYLQKQDDPRIVFDEFCGMFIAAWQLTDPFLLVIAFLLFRFFDIVKPLFIFKLQALPGGWGIMADDIAAGIAARVLLGIIMGIW
ncbi:MAG: phosphatidylglycerophosphatase A [Clostridia bacterium]|jgi:phosphatidylglycerophosphatase A|nr:phosphatidylglycerophosphatase A [Clostridia bacterium]